MNFPVEVHSKSTAPELMEKKMSLRKGKTIQNKLIQHMLNMSHSLITQFT